VKGPIIARTPAYYFDVALNQNGHFNIDIPKTWNSYIFVFEGDIVYNGSTNVAHEHICVLDRETTVHSFVGDKSRFVLIAG